MLLPELTQHDIAGPLYSNRAVPLELDRLLFRPHQQLRRPRINVHSENRFLLNERAFLEGDGLCGSNGVSDALNQGLLRAVG